MHYGGKTKLEKKGRGCRICTPHKSDFIFWAANHSAIFHQNRIKIAAARVHADRKTVWHKVIS